MLSLLKEPTKKRGRGRPPLTAAQIAERTRQKEEAERQKAQQQAQVAAIGVPTAMERVAAAFAPGSALHAIVGLILGGFVPLASYTIVHKEVETRPQLWILVSGGLVYSAISVYNYGKQRFKNRARALGFVVLLEGTLTVCRVTWLSLLGLCILIVLNATQAHAQNNPARQGEETEDQ